MFEFNATLLVAMISFVVFMFIMNAIFYRPILNIIRKRDNLVEQNYKHAKEMTYLAQKNNDEYQTKLNDAKEQSNKEIIEELELAKSVSAEKIHKAKEQTKIQIENNKETLNAQKAELYNRLNSDITEDISSEILKKVMG